MADIIQQSISSNVKLNLDFSSPKVEYLLQRGTKVLCSLIQVYSFNRAKQREKMEFELEAIGSLTWEAELAVRQVTFLVETIFCFTGGSLIRTG